MDGPDLRRPRRERGRSAEHAAIRGEAPRVRLRRCVRDQLGVRVRLPARQHGQGPLRKGPAWHQFAIVDEVDNILIDEARTPLIISGAPEQAADLYVRFARLAPQMKLGKTPEGMDPRSKRQFVADFDYEIDEKHKTVSITEQGVAKAERFLGIDHLYRAENGHLVNHLIQSLRAESLYKRDVDYAVIDAEVKIIDEFTGRILEGRRWSEGLHQAVEAKERVPIQEENQTLATITYQNYFRLYDKLAGMTGTALTEATEFMKIYELPVVQVPTNEPMIRDDRNDQIYKTKDGKWAAVLKEICARHANGQPVLVGTISVEVSELLSKRLTERGVKHTVLNAKPEHAAREAEIVAEAGQAGAVTIATNMAGRGVDIKLGGNPEHLARLEVARRGSDDSDHEAHERALQEVLPEVERRLQEEREHVIAAGGLFICGTERHESRRIDNQLRGRSGRQGDPGVSKFYLSLEDDLMRIFGSERIAGLMERLGMQEGEVIEHRWLSKSIESAQKRVEGHNFDIRKNLLEYDDVMNQQRRTIYKLRRKVLSAGAGLPLVEFDEDPRTKVKTRTEKVYSWADFKELVLDAVEDVIITMTETYCGTRNPDSWDLPALEKAIKDVLNSEMKFSRQGTKEDLQDQIFTVVEKQYTAREQEAGEPFHRFLQVRFLATIDQLWKDHLLAMDHLRQGIGLRGYGQKDPKQEYKKEGYDGFIRMLGSIKGQFVSRLMRVEVRNAEEDAERMRRQMEQRRRAAVEGRANAEGKMDQPAKQAAVRTGPRVGRNDPCPCGSGKKYKK